MEYMSIFKIDAIWNQLGTRGAAFIKTHQGHPTVVPAAPPTLGSNNWANVSILLIKYRTLFYLLLAFCVSTYTHG